MSVVGGQEANAQVVFEEGVDPIQRAPGLAPGDGDQFVAHHQTQLLRHEWQCDPAGPGKEPLPLLGGMAIAGRCLGSDDHIPAGQGGKIHGSAWGWRHGLHFGSERGGVACAMKYESE